MEKLLRVLELSKPGVSVSDFLEATDLYGQGILDSFDIIVILDEINAAFNIDIGAADFKRADFMTVSSIMDMVGRYEK